MNIVTRHLAFHFVNATYFRCTVQRTFAALQNDNTPTCRSFSRNCWNGHHSVSTGSLIRAPARDGLFAHFALARWKELDLEFFGLMLDGKDVAESLVNERRTVWQTLRASPFLRSGEILGPLMPEAMIAAEGSSLVELDEHAQLWLTSCRAAVAEGRDPATDPEAIRHLERLARFGRCRARYVGDGASSKLE